MFMIIKSFSTTIIFYIYTIGTKTMFFYTLCFTVCSIYVLNKFSPNIFQSSRVQQQTGSHGNDGPLSSWRLVGDAGRQRVFPD